MQNGMTARSNERRSTAALRSAWPSPESPQPDAAASASTIKRLRSIARLYQTPASRIMCGSRGIDMPGDNPLDNIVDNPTEAPLPARTKPVQAIIIHTTGSGSTWQQILNFYTDKNGYQPHYAIETDGTIHRTADESLVAWH